MFVVHCLKGQHKGEVSKSPRTAKASIGVSENFPSYYCRLKHLLKFYLAWATMPPTFEKDTCLFLFAFGCPECDHTSTTKSSVQGAPEIPCNHSTSREFSLLCSSSHLSCAPGQRWNNHYPNAKHLKEWTEDNPKPSANGKRDTWKQKSSQTEMQQTFWCKKIALKTQLFLSDCAILFGIFYRFYFIISFSTLSIQQMSSPLAAEWHHYCGILGATENG